MFVRVCEFRRPDGRKCMRAASAMRVVGNTLIHIIIIAVVDWYNSSNTNKRIYTIL